MPPGITLDKARDMADALRSAALEFPEVSYIVTQTGRNDDGTDYWTPSHIEASVGLHPYGEWKSGLTKQQLIAKMAARDRKSTRLNSSHLVISYAVFCLKKK